MINIIVNPQENSSGWVLNADLEGNLGQVTLHLDGNLEHGCYLGFYTPKHCVRSYFDSVKRCVDKYLQASPSQPLTVFAHPWTTGLGRTILKDLIRLTDPRRVTEYFYELSSLEAVLEDDSSLAGLTSYSRSPVLESFKVAKPKQGNIRNQQHTRLKSRLGLASWGDLQDQAPYHAFMSELTILKSDQKLSPDLYPGLIGKVCGLLKGTDGSFSCTGIAVIRDVNIESDLISIVTSTDIKDVTGLAIACGEDTLELPLEAFWSDKSQHAYEQDLDFVFDDAILVHKMSRHHPSRSYLA